MPRYESKGKSQFLLKHVQAQVKVGKNQDTLAEEAGKKHFQLWKDKVFHLGLYVDQASLVIKLTENKAKSNVHPSNRLSFSPFLKLELRGIFQDIKSIGVHTVNVRNGISGMSLIPLGIYEFANFYHFQ